MKLENNLKEKGYAVKDTKDGMTVEKNINKENYSGRRSKNFILEKN